MGVHVTRLMKSTVIAAGVLLSSTLATNAASINLGISNISAKPINFYGAPSCTNCTLSHIAVDIQPYSGDVSTATSTAGATSMTYIISYYGTYQFGTQFVQKGCRATITAELTDGKITTVTSAGWSPFVGNPTCSMISNPQIDGAGNVSWAVRLAATGS